MKLTSFCTFAPLTQLQIFPSCHHIVRILGTYFYDFVCDITHIMSGIPI